MSGNTFGHLFTVSSFGESHGPAIGCVVDGCPPGLEISAEEITFPVKMMARMGRLTDINAGTPTKP